MMSIKYISHKSYLTYPSCDQYYVKNKKNTPLEYKNHINSVFTKLLG